MKTEHTEGSYTLRGLYPQSGIQNHLVGETVGLQPDMWKKLLKERNIKLLS